ncbi:T9SS type A sorting domain-containing protein [Parabacteroides sp. OttesenSCG-928-G06]|nr:T9SS type A sorting domain-containing protein [Parabacteroides sp. OttesenSCG-928-K15]MDL2281621.1 T9SS type A sorting domain-containing protein [Parabacteroides sp. OttesenSCG-928-G06]
MKILYFINIMLLLQTGVWVSAQEKKVDIQLVMPRDTTTLEDKKTTPPINVPLNITTQEEKKEPEITVYGNRFVVSNAPIGSKMEIFSVAGVKVKELEMKQAAGEYVVNLDKGYYIIRIGKTVRRAVIR